MTFHHRNNHKPLFVAPTGGTGTAAGTAGAGAAGDEIAKNSDPISAGYQKIFQEQMQQQMELYRVITKLNDDKNNQSSYLSLAKGVSEMV